ncbi:transcription repressor OFP13-like [Neltuma alba]|uniref:transcription repressor OFP13-like n=1 Tax=Neltuma alba TaxID=207710 RepID=UPI0010A3BD3F|nr:transcription repressor OFP13-like [Prosopis alba]
MRKSMKLSSFFRTKRAPKLLHPCQFLPYCGQPNTLSFRKPNHLLGDDSQIQATSLSVESSDLLDYCNNNGEYSLEKLVRDVVRSSEKLFFEPNGGNKSPLLVVAEPATDEGVASVTDDEGSKLQSEIEIRKLKGKEKVDEDEDDDGESEVGFCDSVFMALESNDPYEDFKKSMQEMVEFHEVKDWEKLEELLTCYLVVNHKKNHEFIFRAFLDLFSIEN